jgi:hypothetical protein
MRIVLCHLNIALEEDDERTVKEIEEKIEGALEVGLNEDPMKIDVALIEEI